MEFDRYTLCLLVRQPGSSNQEPDSGTVQDAHLAYLASLHDTGMLLAAGPLLAGPDPEFRGVCLLRTSKDEAVRLGDDDPAVRAGRLTYRCFDWTIPAGALTRSEARFPRSMAEVEAPDPPPHGPDTGPPPTPARHSRI
jgi:uncharacterized protein